MQVTFRTYTPAQESPFNRFPPGKRIVAEALADGRYVLHVRLPNGLGLTTETTFSLHEAAALAFRWGDALGYSDREIWLDLTEEVLNQPGVLNRKLKKSLLGDGTYWHVVRRQRQGGAY